MSSSHNIIEKIKNDLRFIVLEPNLNHFSNLFKPNSYFMSLKEDLEMAISKISTASYIDVLNAYDHHYRLGIYAENLLGLYFQYSDRYDLIEKNTQLIINKRTIGEIDYIVFDNQDKKLKHIELGCKFYIQMGKEINEWVGPNPKDNLAKKSKKLIKQLELSRKQHPTLEAIRDKYNSDFCREAWIKGRLFGNEDELPSGSQHISCGKIFKGLEPDNSWEAIKKISWLSTTKENATSASSDWDDAQMLIKYDDSERAFYLSEKWLSDYQHSVF